MAILETKKLTKQFGGVRAVDRLSISLEEGEITGIIGPNGSGKTTLINLLTGMKGIDGGTVAVGGVRFPRVKSYQVATYGITRTFQKVRLFEQMSVLDNILVVLTKRNIYSAFFEKHRAYHLEKAKKVLEEVDLWKKKDDEASSLSYGQRKLLEIARAIALDGEIYLLDEPFAGLFPEMVDTVAEIVKTLRDEGKTVVLIEHNIDLIRSLSDNLIVLDSGKLLASGEPEVVLKKPEVIDAYLGD